jgi:2-methylisocitrate lyase-like PEP mutase family enzyme
MISQQVERADAFRKLHAGPGILVLPNAWDGGSARLLASLGFPALATTSSGVAWALGKADGENLTVEEMLGVVSRVASVAGVPVTADMEAGYAQTPAGVAETIRKVIRAGAIGVNLEDGTRERDRPLVEVSTQLERLEAAREASQEMGVPLFINARTDVYLAGVGKPEGRLDDAIERALAYLGAGADGIFVPGVTDVETIARLVQSIPAPLNVILVEGTPPVAELQRIGVRRLSTGGRLAQAAMGVVKSAAEEIREKGTYAEALRWALPFDDLQALFSET